MFRPVVKGHDSRVALEFLQKLDFVPESLGLDFCRVPGLVTSFNSYRLAFYNQISLLESVSSYENNPDWRQSFFDGVLEPLCLKQLTRRCPCFSVVSQATHKAKLKAFKGMLCQLNNLFKGKKD